MLHRRTCIYYTIRGLTNLEKSKQINLEADLYIDNVKVETAKLPTAMQTRRHELFWKLNLPKGKHDVKMVLKNPNAAYKLRSEEYVTYTESALSGKILIGGWHMSRLFK